MDQSDAVPIDELWEERRFLLDVAHWMLGDPGAADSVVDEAYHRLYELSDTARRPVTVPRAWLARTVGGICLDRLERPGRVNALESLPTAERAALVFRVFGMAPGAVADIVGRTEPELAELGERARQWLRLRRTRPTTPQQQDAVAHAVRRACATADGELLTSLLSSDAAAFFDGGGKVRALTGPVHGCRPVADSLLTLLARSPHTTLTTHSVNGRTGLVARYGHRVAAVISLDVSDDRVVQVWVMLNPDKLRSWNRRPT
ncbi:sigma factor [Streptomyces sp. CA-249302]|uniref:sigma factor n=1 Tax=Streptomyces sp. CA-249302 TaxID=3240058 RepID=UPI003D8FCAD9